MYLSPGGQGACVPTYVCCTLPLDSSAPFCALTSPLRTPTPLSARCICPYNQGKILFTEIVACLASHHTGQHNKIFDVPPCLPDKFYTAIHGITRTLHGNRCCPSAWTSTSTNACNAISLLPQQSPSHQSTPLTMRTRSSNNPYFILVAWSGQSS